MNWFTSWFKKEVKAVEPVEEKPKFVIKEVGLADVLVTYIDANNNVIKHMGCIVGSATCSKEHNLPYFDSDEDSGYKHIIKVYPVKNEITKWLKECKKNGGYLMQTSLGEKFIPRERVLEIFITYEKYEVRLELE